MYVLFYLLDAREILTDSDEAGHIAVSRSQRPEGDPDRYLLAIASPEAELVAGCGLAAFGDGLAHVVEIHAVAEDGVPRLIDRLVRPDSGDGLRRSVKGGDLPGGIHADEAGADRLEDQVPKRLEIREMLTLILHVLLEFVIPPSQRAGEDGHEQENPRIHEDGQDLDRGVLGRLADLEHRKDGPTPHRQHVEGNASVNRSSAPTARTIAAVSSRARFSPQRDDRSTCDLGNQRSRYLTSVTSLKIGRYMATTSPPTTTPRKTIMMGSRSEVSVLTAVSTSSS